MVRNQISPRKECAPLHGVKVLDLTTFLSGPFCTQILGDLGADIVKVEPPSGDPTRHVPPYFIGGESVYYLSSNRNKRSIALDLKSEEGKDLLIELLKVTDIVIENYRPGVLERLGISPNDWCERRPDLIWASISGFGQYGIDRDKPAYDMIVQALAGVMSITGEEGRPAARLGIPAGDTVAGLYAAIAICASLFGKTVRGRGERIDVAMLDCQLAMLSYLGSYSMVSNIAPKPQGAHHDSLATYRSFIGSDKKEFVITANTQTMWASLCEAIDRPELITSALYVDSGARLKNKDILWPILESAFASNTAAYWVDRLQLREVPAALIKSVPEALLDAKSAGRDMLMKMVAADGEEVEVVGQPIHLSSSLGDPIYPPHLNADRTSILRDWLKLD